MYNKAVTQNKVTALFEYLGLQLMFANTNDHSTKKLKSRSLVKSVYSLLEAKAG